MPFQTIKEKALKWNWIELKKCYKVNCGISGQVTTK